MDELSEKCEAVELQEKDELKPMSNDVKHLSPWSITKTLIGELFFKRNIRIFALVIFIFCISKGTIAHGNLFSIKIQDLGFDRAYLGQISDGGPGNVTLWASIELHRLGHRNRDLR